MAKRLEYDIVTDASKGIAGLKQFSSAAKKAMGDVNDSLDDTTTSAQKVAKALAGLADELETEMKGAAKAADALADALGPEISSRANLDSVVQDLHKMGLSFDEITADADALADSLKKLDAVQLSGAGRGMQDIDESARRAKGGIDEVGKSADSSKSVLANMVGNATQDLGALGGLAGSAGVAIGQMGEYMADAKASGEGFGTILKSFAGVAGPIAAIGVATQLVSDHMADIAETKAFNKERVQAYVDALDDAKVTAGELLDILNQDEPTGIFARVDEETVNLDESVQRTLGTFQAFQDQLAKPRGVRDYADEILHSAKAAELSANEHADLERAVKASLDGEVDGITILRARNAGMEDEVKTLIALGAARKTGTAGVERAKFEEQFYADALDETAASTTAATDAAQRDNEALQARRDAVQKTTEDQKRYAIAIGKAQGALDEMASEFSTLGRKSDALSAIFDVKNAPKKTAGDVRDVALAVDDLSEKLKDVKVSDVLAGDVKADKFLDAIDALAPDIQARITETFGTGGPEAATALANSYIDQVTKELGGKFTREQVATMLGLDDLEATINVAVEQSELDKARKKLEVLVGLKGETPWTASIGMALDAGEITPEAAQLLLDAQLKGEGVVIPSALETPPTAETIAEAQKYADTPGNEVTLPTLVTDPTNLDFMLTDAQTELNKSSLTVPVKVKLDNKAFDFLFNDAGGTVGPDGGIVAEKRPEIVNGRYLVMSPTVVPPGTRVTSGARTARILRTRGTRGLRKYDAGGTVTAAPINVNISAGVIGNTYDLMNTVSDAVRRAARLLPRNP